MDDNERLSRLETEIERRLTERFAGLRDEFDRLRLESDRRWAGFLDRFDQDFTGLVPPELVGTPEPPPAPSASSPASRQGMLSADDVRRLDEAASQVEALNRFLELSRSRASRIVLLVSRAGNLSVWKAVGFSERRGDDEAVRRVQFPQDGGGPFRDVLSGTPERLSAGNDVSERLEASDAVDAVVFPIVVKEKVSGAVYGDAVEGEEGRFDPEGIGLLTYLAGVTIDRLASRKLRPAPPLRPLQARGATQAPDQEIPLPREIPLTRESPAPMPREWDAAPAEPVPAEGDLEDRPAAPQETTQTLKSAEAAPQARPREVEYPQETEVPEEAEAPEPEEVDELEAHDETEEHEVDMPAATMRIPQQDLEAATRRMPPVAPEPVPARDASPARRLAGPLAPAEPDERREEARRFAKLLVSEIKLYNERAVVEGREKGNLYQRLKDDIDRSRQMYDERIPEDIRSSSNFFYDELVRTLADGRADVLGL